MSDHDENIHEDQARLREDDQVLHRDVQRVPDEEGRVANDEKRLHEDEGHHLEITIFVNGRAKVVTTREVSYDEIVALAFGSVPSDPNVIFNVTYSHGESGKRQGRLAKGTSVRVHERMVFDVTTTNRS